MFLIRMNCTLKIPWLDFVEIDVFDDVQIDTPVGNLPPEIIVDEFFVGRMESEARRNM